MNRSRAGATVLLVEDDSNDVLLLQRAFHKAQLACELQVAEDGEVAVDYLLGTGPYADRQRYPWPALLLLDLKLPRRTGLEVLAWRREQAGVARVPALVLTSSREASDVARAYDLGANAYLVKPVAFGTLLDLVRAIDGFWLQLNELAEAPEPR